MRIILSLFFLLTILHPLTITAQECTDEQVLERLKKANATIAGTVEEVFHHTPQLPISEHNPYWADALVRIDPQAST